MGNMSEKLLSLTERVTVAIQLVERIFRIFSGGFLKMKPTLSFITFFEFDLIDGKKKKKICLYISSQALIGTTRRLSSPN